MTDTEKITTCHDYPKVHAIWKRMSPNEKHEFLKRVTSTDENILIELAGTVRREFRRKKK